MITRVKYSVSEMDLIVSFIPKYKNKSCLKGLSKLNMLGMKNWKKIKWITIINLLLFILTFKEIIFD